MGELQPLNLMHHALILAQRGRGLVEPNPMVGCLLVSAGHIIAEGYHRRFGGPHAEREALANCTQSPAGATAYVTLEPCCHTAKKTPPCVPALIEARLQRVIIASLDPNPQVAGRGAQQLRDAGIEVQVGLLEKQAQQLNAPFFARVRLARPYVTLKWAQTADGKVAGPGGQRLQISNPASMTLVHQLRARSDAILVGLGTVLKDNPLLTPRGVEQARPLLRCVLDSHLRIPLSTHLVQTARQSPLVVYCSAPVFCQATDKVNALLAAGAQVMPVIPASSAGLALGAVLEDLYTRSVTHLLVEGGPTVARSFLAANLADRLWIFHAPTRLDASSAPAAPQADFPLAGHAMIDSDRLEERLNPHSPAFFDLCPSADLMDAQALFPPRPVFG